MYKYIHSDYFFNKKYLYFYYKNIPNNLSIKKNFPQESP
ncbi:hypothetical protein B4168_0396 [Anoxybacillus flavithermus]|nr:hypothetical protein B4168_0396 [Anoxybacillus flavithermus]OAO87342.1 hypothetical protein GT23_1310 [Parageobacillus thermoglucosidasius]